jgi:uncharacterized protein YegL
MDNRATDLVFILDRSGSMSGLESDTIGGFNAFLKKQQAEPGAAFVTTVLFNDEYELLHHRVMIQDIPPITEKVYFVGGTTALFDAIGKTIHMMDRWGTPNEDQNHCDQLLFVITTDGLENASREYSFEMIRQMIGQKKGVGWEFVFLGANIDAIAVARTIGIHESRSATYHADEKGICANYEAIHSLAMGYRRIGTVQEDWKLRIEDDFHRRKHG